MPKTRWSIALNQQLARIRLLDRFSYYGSWIDHFDARFVRGPDSPLLAGRSIIDLDLSIPLGEGVTLSVGGQNIADTFCWETRLTFHPSGCPPAAGVGNSDRMDLFAEVFGLPTASSRHGAERRVLLRRLHSLLERASPLFGGQGAAGSMTVGRPLVLPRLVLRVSPVLGRLTDCGMRPVTALRSTNRSGAGTCPRAASSTCGSTGSTSTSVLDDDRTLHAGGARGASGWHEGTVGA